MSYFVHKTKYKYLYIIVNHQYNHQYIYRSAQNLKYIFRTSDIEQLLHRVVQIVQSKPNIILAILNTEIPF